MSITVNGQSRVPPGFRFHPTEEELLNYYLRKKVACEKIELDVIRDVDLNKLEPWDIQEKCKIGSTPQNDWYFFSHKDKKYPTGTRTNRATAAGFWKATGRDKIIYTSLKRIGMRKTLVFYQGRAPHGQKSDWIMHEYRLDEHQDNNSQSNACSSLAELTGQEDGWVVCRVFKKKNYHKTLNSPNNYSSISTEGKTQMVHRHSGNDDRSLDQMLQYMGRSTCNHESERNPSKVASILENPSATATTTNNSSSGNYMKYLLPIEVSTAGNSLLERFMKLPALESPTNFPGDCPQQIDQFSRCSEAQPSDGVNANISGSLHQPETNIHDWAALDRLVASHLNGQSEASRQLTCFDDDTRYAAFCSTAASTALMSCNPHEYNNGDGDMDLWAFTGSVSSSGSDLHCHTSE